MSAVIAGVRGNVSTVLQGLLAGIGSLAPEQALERLCESAVTLLPATSVAVLLVSECDGEHVTASVARGAPVPDELLREALAGPCRQLRARGCRDGAIVVGDVRKAAQWPNLCRRAHTAGFVSLTIAPLLADPEGFLGALVVCHDRPGGVIGEQVRRLELLTAAAAHYERANRRLRRAWDVARQLERALSSRVVVEQAKGFLAGRLGLSPDDAFHVLRGYARPRNMKIEDVGRRLLDGSLDPATLLQADRIRVRSEDSDPQPRLRSVEG